MSKEMLPKLDESDIRNLAREGSFKRGVGYYRDGAIIEPVRQGMVLRAECRGSRYAPYQVSATLGKGGIEEVRCSCPYTGGGICKHAVALLLTYVHERAFRVIQPWEEMLAGHNREELVALIGEIVRGQPDLLSRVELLAGSRQGKPIDVETYRRQVRHVMGHRSLDAVEWGLQPLTDTADKLAEAGDWLNAGTVYYTLLDEAVGHYDDDVLAMDEAGDIAMLLAEFAEGLIKCLAEGKPEGEVRRAWLEALLDAELRDIQIGGIDLAPGARDALLAHAIDKEWEWIEERVRVQIQKSSGWAQGELVDFLAERRGKEGRREAAAALIRELGTPEQQAFLIVEEGKIDEAMRLIHRIVAEKPGLLTEFADALVEAGAEEAAVGLAAAHAKGRGSLSETAWLARYYRERGNQQASLEWQQEAFLQRPSVDAFKTLREVGGRAGRWEQMRSDMLKVLESENRIGPLIEIALDEGDVARALELMPRLTGWSWRDYKREVAQAAEKDHPREAAALYKEMAEDAIEGRQRSAYQQAARDLERVKGLYERLGADWNAYIQTLRTRYARFPALQDELDKAHL